MLPASARILHGRAGGMAMKAALLFAGVPAAGLVGLLALAGGGHAPRQAAPAASGVTVLQVTNHVLMAGVTRLGINLGDQNYYDSGQMLKNLIYRNPGFEGMVYRSIFHCQEGGASRCIDTRQGIKFPQGFWDGARYSVLVGAAAGRMGSLIGAEAGPDGYSLHLDGRKTPIGDGDWIAVEKRFPGDPAAGWWPRVSGGAQLLAERGDLPPGAPGQQALRMDAAGPGQSAQVNSYFDSTAGMTFVHLRGRYRLSFRAKAVRGSAVLHVHVGRTISGTRRYLDEDVRLTRAWSTYNQDFSANEVNLLPGGVEVGFGVTGGTVLLDDADLEKIDGDPANHTVFRDQVVDTLRRLHPGVLRMMASNAGIGSTIDNLLGPPFDRQRPGFRAWYDKVEDIPVGIPEFLELCREVGAEPWIVAPTAMSLDETKLLAEYLAGNASTPGGALRAQAGRVEPWTQAFHTIHIELGNETWNGGFEGESIEDPAAYGRRANAVFTAFRADAGAAASHFDLVVGTQAYNPDRNSALLAAAPAANTLAIAPYLMMSVTQWANDDQLYGPLLAEPEQMSRTGIVARSAASAGGRQLAVYEVNLHTTEGDPPQQVLDRLTPSAAAGIAVAGHMLRMMRDHGVRDQMLFSLPQYEFRRADGKTVRLWGSVVVMGERDRPQLLAEMLANRAIAGDLVAVQVSGENPTRDQPPGNDGVHLDNVHEIDAYGFHDGGRYGVVIFNYGLHTARRIRLQGAALTSTSKLTVARLVSSGPGATNEVSREVTIGSEQVAGDELVLPPCSMSVVQW
jgi:hypothetical protein